MPKITKGNDTKTNTISPEMLKSCKSDIAKFGFEAVEFEKFLVSVEASKEPWVVLTYPNSDLETYRDKYLKKHEKNMNDMLLLDTFKIKTSDGENNVYDTGRFCPRSFWSYVVNTF